MVTSWRLVRSGRLAATCAISSAVVCASLSAVVVLATVLEGGGDAKVLTAAGHERALIVSEPCEMQDGRTRAVLKATAERDMRWRVGDEVLRWGEWRVAVGESQIPVRVLVAVVSPEHANMSVIRPGEDTRHSEWTIDKAPLGARVAIGISEKSVLDAQLSITGMPDDSNIDRELFDPKAAAASDRCTRSEDERQPVRARRVAYGVRHDGALLAVLAHFDGIGESPAIAPLGTTIDEFELILQALGARQSALLASGPTAQLLIRESRGGVLRRWPGESGTMRALIIEGRNATPRVNAGDLVTTP